MNSIPSADKLVAVPFANSIGVGVVTEDHGDMLTVVCDEWSEGTLYSVPRKWPKEQVFKRMKDCYRFWLKRHDAMRAEFVKRYGPNTVHEPRSPKSPSASRVPHTSENPGR